MPRLNSRPVRKQRNRNARMHTCFTCTPFSCDQFRSDGTLKRNDRFDILILLLVLLTISWLLRQLAIRWIRSQTRAGAQNKNSKHSTEIKVKRCSSCLVVYDKRARIHNDDPQIIHTHIVRPWSDANRTLTAIERAHTHDRLKMNARASRHCLRLRLKCF